MRKSKVLIATILCMGIFLFWIPVTHVEAKELQNISVENTVIDTRPDYTIYVNRVLNCITIMQQEKDGTLTPVKAMVCSCGREGLETPEGTFKTSDYYEWRQMVDDSYGRYAVRFNKGILFHSVPYIDASPDTLEWEEYNKLGENASLGCVRLSTEDAKWIYDNCKKGTTVIVYSDSENAGTLGKPTSIKIPVDSPFREWDPTDINVNNPWFKGKFAVTPFLGTIDEFDYKAYADRYPDLKDAFGYDKNALYDHYITFGMNEMRIASSY